jgi:transcriptional regulator with XRE-family HTH domain
MSEWTSLTDALRLERLRLRIKQGDLADRLGVTQQALCQWEMGHNPPTLEHARAWLDALSVARPIEIGELFPGLRPCGTLAAYTRHRRRGEPYCDACRDANSAHHRERRGTGVT